MKHYILIFSLSLFSHLAYASQDIEECIPKIGNLNLCDHATELASRANIKLPKNISPTLKLVSITSDKNTLTYHFVSPLTETEIDSLTIKDYQNQLSFKQRFILDFQNKLCITDQATKRFIANGGAVTPELISAEGSILAIEKIDNCKPIQASIENDTLLLLATPRSNYPTKTTDLPQSNDNQLVFNNYANSVKNKFLQLLNIPLSKPGSAPNTIQLVIGINGQLLDASPGNSTSVAPLTAIQHAKEASPYPPPPMTLIKQNNAVVVTIQYLRVTHTYTPKDNEYYKRYD